MDIGQLPEIRWIQRLDNYEKAVNVLERIFSISKKRKLTEAEKMGLIQSFEFTFELAWKLMKDFLVSKGIIEIIGSKDAIKQAFSDGIIQNGEVWMSMIDIRNETSHVYDEEIALRVVENISNLYIEEFNNFLANMKKYRNEHK